MLSALFNFITGQSLSSCYLKLVYPFQGHGGGGELEPIPADTGQLRGSPWIKLKPITGLTYKNKQPLTLTVTPMDSLVTD